MTRNGMGMNVKVCAWAAVVLPAWFAGAVWAAPIELIVNGEFEDPPIAVIDDFEKIPNANVPGWTNTGTLGHLELWKEGGFNSPDTGVDGQPTGQHLELTSDSGNEEVYQTFTVPCCAVSPATFNFDGWPRDGTLVNFAFVDSSGFPFFQSAIFVGGSPNNWISYDQVWPGSTVPVTPCEEITLRFWSSGGQPPNGDGGSHIDQVSFIVECPDPIGGCCLPDGTCVQVTQLECCAEDGTYHGDGVPCEGEEACCLSDGTCVVVDKLCCEDREGLNGTAQGPSTVCLGDTDSNGVDDVCEPFGACCLPWGACIVSTQEYCEAQLGAYLGDNTQCAGDEACCLPDGSCVIADKLCCETQLGGQPQGPGSLCLGDLDMNGLDDGCQCREIFNGTPIPDCAGLCPDPGFECQQNAAAMCDCVQVELTGACCLQDGTCFVTTSIDCQAQMGTYKGDNTTCAGDADSNGVDDACECGVATGPAGLVCEGVCPGPVPPFDECRPSCINYDPATGQVTITGCACREQNDCYVDINSTPPRCLGVCPTTGDPCLESQIPQPDNTIDICCDCPPGALLGDCNNDRAIDATDHESFAGCITGPDLGPVDAECVCADLDVDTDVDLRDFRDFQSAVAGP